MGKLSLLLLIHCYVVQEIKLEVMSAVSAFMGTSRVHSTIDYDLICNCTSCFKFSGGSISPPPPPSLDINYKLQCTCITEKASPSSSITNQSQITTYYEYLVTIGVEAVQGCFLVVVGFSVAPPITFFFLRAALGAAILDLG